MVKSGPTKGIMKYINKFVAYFQVYLLMLVLCVVVAIIVHFFPSDGVIGSFSAGKQTFFIDSQFAGNADFYQNIEDFIISEIRETFGAVRDSILFSSTFRYTAVLLATLAMVLMGFSMLIGEHKITVKEFSVDIFIIFGTVSLLLSENVIYYIDFFYGMVVSIANWITHSTVKATFAVTNLEFLNQNSTKDVNIYAPLDIIASIFFDSNVSNIIRTKLIGLIYSGSIYLVPIISLALLYTFVTTITVFAAFLLAKVTILLSLTILPFFILFASVNDVKIKMTKRGGAKSFLWTLIDAGILKPWVYLALMSSATSVLYYVLVVQNIENLFNFAVYTPRVDIGNGLRSIPLLGSVVGYIMQIIHMNHPRAVGLSHDDLITNLITLIICIFLFTKLFQILTTIINTLAFDPKEGALANLFSGNGGIFSKNSHVGGGIQMAKSFIKSRAMKYTVGYSSSMKDFRHANKSLTGKIFGTSLSRALRKTQKSHLKNRQLEAIAKKLKGTSLGQVAEQWQKLNKDRANLALKKRDILKIKNLDKQQKAMNEYRVEKAEHLNLRKEFEKNFKKDIKEIDSKIKDLSPIEKAHAAEAAKADAKKTLKELEKQSKEAQRKLEVEEQEAEKQKEKEREEKQERKKAEHDRQKQIDDILEEQEIKRFEKDRIDKQQKDQEREKRRLDTIQEGKKKNLF